MDVVAGGTIERVFVGRLEGVITRERPASTKSLSVCLPGESVISQRAEVHNPNVCERLSIDLTTIARGNPFEDRCELPGPRAAQSRFIAAGYPTSRRTRCYRLRVNIANGAVFRAGAPRKRALFEGKGSDTVES
jgi:hypothetical protein